MTDYNIDFKDHKVQFPNRFKQVQVSPGVVDLVPTWVENPSEVIEEGTPVNAELFERLKENVSFYSENFTATEGQTVFTLSDEYNIGQNRVLVWVSGVKQRTVIDFVESSTTTITFNEPLSAGDEVEVFRVSAVQPLSNDIQNQVDMITEYYSQTTQDVNSIRLQLAEKITKGKATVWDIDKNLGKFDQTYMTDAFLAQIAGTSAINAVPADYSVTTTKLAFSPILGIKSKNLFNKDTVQQGKYLNIANGGTVDNASYFVSDYIKVSPNTAYYLKSNVNARTAFYDANKSYVASSFTSNPSFTTTAATEYIRITSLLTNLNDTQVEVGNQFTGYESNPSKLDPVTIALNSLPGDRMMNKSLRLEKIKGFERGKNLFDKSTITAGQSLNGNTGLPFVNADYYTSDFILVEPSTQYTIGPNNAFTKVCYYTSLQGFISVEPDGTTTFTTPSTARYVRFSNYNASLNAMQMETGNVATSYEAYMEDLATLKIDERISAQVQARKPILKFNDAWVAWRNGEKFPMAFYGDSTFDGMGTTGFSGNAVGIDGNGKSPNSFPVKLQGLLRSITGNNVLRIYNAGFSGMKADWGVTNLAAEFSGSAAYADVKMVGIGFGINDRLSYQTEKAYRDGFKAHMVAMIDWFYARGIQPFLVTSQAITAPGVEEQYKTTFPLRTAMHIETIANEVKRDLAQEYGLEIIDINKFTEEFLLYSSYPAKVIAADRTHFGDVGHNYEAGVMFSHVTPITYFVDGYTKIDYTSQQLMTGIPEELMTVPDAPSDVFKAFANYTKADALDAKIMDVYVFNSGRKQLGVKAYKNATDSLTYVKVNGVTTTLSSLQTTLSQMDLGLYRLEVFTGLSNKVDFKGFIIE